LSCGSCCSTVCQFSDNLHRVMKSPSLLVALAVASFMTSHCLYAEEGDDVQQPKPSGPDLKKLAKAITFFSMDMHTVLSETKESFLFSPIGIHLALVMALVGAKGPTANEMKIALEVKNIKNLEEQYKGWLDTTTDNCHLGKDCEMQLNKTFMFYPGVKVENKFATTINSVYTPSVVALETKTGWTSISFFTSLTKEAHKQTLSMIFNVLNLRLRWRRKFIYNSGNYMDFTTSTFQKVKTTSMRVRGSFRYAFSHALNGHVLKIPFENDRFGFYIIQPTTADGLAKLEGKLARRSLHLDQVLDSVKVRDVLVELPLLRFADVIELEAPLRKLGINAAFAYDADFTKATPLRCNIGQARQVPLMNLG
ncbi:unnamed protein product, partial [Lymnaea stagnalis]